MEFINSFSLIHTLIYKPTSFIYHIERFYIPLPAASMKAVGGNCSLTGELPDGRRVNVRDHSSDGRPTLEVQEGKNRIKVRYGEGD